MTMRGFLAAVFVFAADISARGATLVQIACEVYSGDGKYRHGFWGSTRSDIGAAGSTRN